MFLAIYVYGELGLTLDLRAAAGGLPPDAMRPGPGAPRLTADPAILADPAKVENWLRAFLPENGSAVPWRAHARRAWEPLGINPNRRDPGAILWGNCNAEYAGAVEFRQSAADPPTTLDTPGHGRIEPISDAAIGERLDLATLISERGTRVRPSELLQLPGQRVSLSGMRGKLGLVAMQGNGWGITHDGALSTWICKHEQRPTLPAEAGLEAICQRTLQAVRIRAADTVARIFDGRQAVLSRRSDRATDAEGRTRARHQEEWAETTGQDPEDKYDEQRRNELRWDHAYALLEARAATPHRAKAELTRILIATWLLGHADLHRRNLGFRHRLSEEPPGIELAPAYDVSSAVGTRYGGRLAIAIDQALDVHRVGPVQWQRLSEAGGTPPEVAAAAADELIAVLPDALADTARKRAGVDENLDETALDRRVDQTIEHVRARGRAWQSQRNTMIKRAAPGYEPETERLAATIRLATEQWPDGRVVGKPAATGTGLNVHYEHSGLPAPHPLGAARSPRALATAAAKAGCANPEDIPELARSLEREREQSRARGR